MGTKTVILKREVWTREWNILLEVVMELVDYWRTPYQTVPRIEWYFSEIFFLPKRSLYQILDRNDFLVKVIIIKNIYILIAGSSRK